MFHNYYIMFRSGIANYNQEDFLKQDLQTLGTRLENVKDKFKEYENTINKSITAYLNN